MTIKNKVLLLLVIIFLILSPILFVKGVIINGDFSAISLVDAYPKISSYLWNPFGSINNFEILDRYPFTIFTFILTILGTSADTYTKVLIFFGFALAAISFFFAIKFIFDKEIDPRYKSLLYDAAFVSALFYAFNVWSFHRITHWFIWVAYSILPLFFISSVYSFTELKRWRYIFLTVIIWSFASSTPHMTIFFGLMIIGIFSAINLYCISKKEIVREKLVENLKSFSLIIFLYALINLYWIYPYLLSLKLTIISPSYVVTEEVLQMLSRDSNFLNVFRLIEDWWLPRIINVSPQQDSLLYFIWLPVSYLIPILAFSSLLFIKKYRYISFFLLMAIIGIFLTMGSNAPFNIYSNLVFSIPLSSKFGWVFRDPDKWAFLIAFAYSFLAAITIFEILKFLEDTKYKEILSKIFLVFILVSIAIYSYPTYKDIVEKVYNPIIIPDDFSDLNTYFSVNDNEKVFFMPYSSNIFIETTWSDNHYVGGIYQTFPEKPNIQPLSPDLNNYYNYFIKSMVSNRTNNINNFIYPFGTSYIIYHDDTFDLKDKEILDRLYLLDNINNTENVGFFKIFKTNEDIGQINIPKQNIVLFAGLDKFMALNNIAIFDSINSSLFFLDQKTINNKYDHIKNANSLVFDASNDLMSLYIDDKYIIRPYDKNTRHDPSKVWSKAGINDPLHGPWHSYIERRNIDNWDFDYGKGIVFTWSDSIIDENKNISEEDILDTFNFKDKFGEWHINNEAIQNIALSNNTYSGNQGLQSTLTESSWDWKTIDSPLIPVRYQTPYRWKFYIKGEDSYEIHAKIMEYDIERRLINTEYMERIGTGTFDWKDISIDYALQNKNTAYMQLQIWHGHETNQPLPNKIWIDNAKVYNLSKYIKPVTMDIDMDVDKGDDYELFGRFFKNKDGGRINISIDGDTIKLISTDDQLNKFVWEKISTLNLKKGKHKLTLTNDKGFNAVNVFALIPKKEYQEMEKKIEPLIEGKRLIYIFDAESDLFNTDASVSGKYGGKASNGEVLEFNETSRAWQIINIIRSDNYKIGLKVNGNFNINFDDINYNVSSNMSDFVYIGPLYLTKGYHKIEIARNNNETKDSDLDVIWLYSINNTSEKVEDIFRIDNVPATALNYTKTDPTLYKIKVNATEPFMVSFAESYDPLWTAKIDKIDGKSVESGVIRPIPLYSVVNGFWINQTGNLDITIEYEPQRWFYIGAAISITTLIICIAYFIFDWRKRKDVIIKNK